MSVCVGVCVHARTCVCVACLSMQCLSLDHACLAAPCARAEAPAPQLPQGGPSGRQARRGGAQGHSRRAPFLWNRCNCRTAEGEAAPKGTTHVLKLRDELEHLLLQRRPALRRHGARRASCARVPRRCARVPLSSAGRPARPRRSVPAGPRGRRRRRRPRRGLARHERLQLCRKAEPVHQQQVQMRWPALESQALTAAALPGARHCVQTQPARCALDAASRRLKQWATRTACYGVLLGSLYVCIHRPNRPNKADAADIGTGSLQRLVNRTCGLEVPVACSQ